MAKNYPTYRDPETQREIPYPEQLLPHLGSASYALSDLFHRPIVARVHAPDAQRSDLKTRASEVRKGISAEILRSDSELRQQLLAEEGPWSKEIHSPYNSKMHSLPRISVDVLRPLFEHGLLSPTFLLELLELMTRDIAIRECFGKVNHFVYIDSNTGRLNENQYRQLHDRNYRQPYLEGFMAAVEATKPFFTETVLDFGERARRRIHERIDFFERCLDALRFDMGVFSFKKWFDAENFSAFDASFSYMNYVDDLIERALDEARQDLLTLDNPYHQGSNFLPPGGTFLPPQEWRGDADEEAA